ncbi:hypothetical protein G4G28_15150 [Massilia sp. Dwa41.01b]|uniref:hypothetical protein n=1 Tax=unclassified Massilia TaxID=2609279 RepID=UPI0015FF657A|nr:MULTISPECIES: hypothetical protein [unclassified Massilia]QNA89471.1 hypothetical protein G4G28_15150 [Massilia sp. Dwa41.01b]QNB00376.1 hypothetical protein G4G31_18730 [Massilia sp. Se16.2.3]
MTFSGVLFAGAVCAGLCACSRTDGQDAALGQPGSSGARSYEIVTVERPESVAEYHKMYRGIYEMCAGVRKAKGMGPPAPMLQPPADYITERKTYTSDGKAYLVKEEHFTYHAEVDEPAFSCRTYLEKTSNTQLIRDGKMYDAGVDAQGKRYSEPPQEWNLPPEKSREHLFTEPRMVKGHAVKCMPMLPNTQALITDLCVADLKPGTLTDVQNEPLVLYSRVPIVQKLQSVMVTEPVSVKVGLTIDPAVFDAAAAP